MSRKLAPDQADRDLAIRERSKNVIADAGAGTGKTSLLVARLVELVAPADDGPALQLRRIAGVTFTRKAAGELKLRVRESVLSALSRSDLSAKRRERLAVALGQLDTAYLGTIHGFADRLLRLHPREARLSPAYEICEDTEEIERETYEVLLQACESETLRELLQGEFPPARLAEAEATLLGALQAGLKPDDRDFGFRVQHGLRGLISGFIQTRDAPPAEPKLHAPDLSSFHACAREFIQLARAALGSGSGSGSGAGFRWLQATSRRLAALAGVTDPYLIAGELNRCLAGAKGFKKGEHFDGDEVGWNAWKAWDGDTRKNPVRATALREDLCRPIWSWLARRLVRTQPVVLALYEKVKARHRQVDQVDLLLKLRDLLRDDREVRAHLQGLFDHVFVDELQDTDPLQAEIVVYLCEDGAKARRWDEASLAPGKLTIVGDPKQSIYRFRRADIAMYDSVRSMLTRGPHRVAKLRANFRSVPSLIEWLNERFDVVLETAEEGKPIFDAEHGTVRHERLIAGREGKPEACVHALPLVAAEDAKALEQRAHEAWALARYLRWLVEVDKPQIVDPVTEVRRPVGFGDIAVLAMSTYHLGLLFRQLDALSVPYSARGGRLFLSDPLHLQFLLGLRAVADRDDGVAHAALLRPPFFSLELADLARERAAEESDDGPELQRARAARDLVRELRRRRFERPVGQTARDLLELTGFGRAVALGSNGLQRLERLRELCLCLERVAVTEGLDFDAATARLREWIADPPQLDPPPPLGGHAIQVLTVHQAKGLEFPVVVCWDACADWVVRGRSSAWEVDRDGRGWAVAIEGLEWEEPEGLGLQAAEQRFQSAERKRVVYVAATRARDLLVLPQSGEEPNPRFVWGKLLESSRPELVRRLEPCIAGAPPPEWAQAIPLKLGAPASADQLESTLAQGWRRAVEEVSKARSSPSSVTAVAHEEKEQTKDEPAATPQRQGRFGPLFGETVHRAIGLALGSPELSAKQVVKRIARCTELNEHLAEAAEDVERALKALSAEGLNRRPGKDLRLEYPLASAHEGRLLNGYADLVATRGEELVLLDFKTDPPPESEAVESYPAYVEQARTYARMLEESFGRATVRTGLLFTADGTLHWISRAPTGKTSRRGQGKISA